MACTAPRGFIEPHPAFSGDLTLQDVAADAVLNLRIALIGNLDTPCSRIFTNNADSP